MLRAVRNLDRLPHRSRTIVGGHPQLDLLVAIQEWIGETQLGGKSPALVDGWLFNNVLLARLRLASTFSAALFCDRHDIKLLHELRITAKLHMKWHRYGSLWTNSVCP